MSRFIMDNFSIDVTARQAYDGNPLEDLMRFLMGTKDKLQYYAIRDAQTPEDIPSWEKIDPRPKRLVFYRYGENQSSDIVKHPFPMDYAAVSNFCLEWLKTLDNEDFADEIDLDGDLAKGWRVWNESWGHVDGHYGTLFAISPNWAWIGK